MSIAPRVSLADIARKAKVSKMTVSLALRGETRISQPTRDRVRRIADALGYRPDPALTALNAYRRAKTPPISGGVIACLNNLPAPFPRMPERYYHKYLQGIQQRGAQLGFEVQEFWLNEPGMNHQAADRILKSRGIHALLVFPQPRPHARIELDWDHYSALSLGFSLEFPQLNIVINDQFRSTSLCVEKLVEYGYRRIGLLIDEEQDARTNNRWSGGFYATLEKLLAGLDQPSHLKMKTFDEQAVMDWIKDQKPEAIITGFPDLVGILQYAGIRVPDDVGIVKTFDSTTDVDAQVAHINENSIRIGEVAMDMLASMIYRNEKGVPVNPLRILVEGCWEEGATIRRLGP